MIKNREQQSENYTPTKLVHASHQLSPDEPAVFVMSTIDPDTNREEVITITVPDAFELLHAAHEYQWDTRAASGKNVSALIQGSQRRSARAA